jgi:nitrogen-specific signal transduction histidine kinase
MKHVPGIQLTVSNSCASFKLGKYSPIIMIGVWIAALASIFPFLIQSSYMGSAGFHGMIEMVGALCGMVSGFIFIVHFWAFANRLFLFIGLAFFINGAEDLAHGFMGFASFHNWIGLPASSLAKFIPGTYVTGRFVMAIMLSIASLLPLISGKSRNSHTETLWSCPITVVVVSIITVGVFYSPLPQFIIPDWIIPRPVDFLSAFTFCIALFGCVRLYYRTHNSLILWVAFSVAANIVGQFIMSFSKVLYDPCFDMAHVYKVFGYIIPMLGFSLYQILVVNERNQAIEELRILTDTLDRRVAERTAELRESDKALRVKISEHKRAEEQLSIQKDFLNNIIEFITHPFYVIDANNYTVIMANHATHFGDLSEKTTCYELTHRNNAPCEGVEIPCPLNEVKRTKKPVVVEHLHYDKVGNLRHCEVYGFPLFDDKGEVAQMIEYTIDTTERRKVEEQLKVAHKMASLGQLTAGVFHEILNPINIISSHVQLLLMDTEKGSQTEEDLKSVQEEIGRVVKITDSLLIYSMTKKREVGQIDINSLLDKTILIVEPELKCDNINFVRKFEAKLPEIMACSDELRQVILNLTTNAIGAMPDSGTITIITQSVEMEGNPLIRIRYSDTGCGIDKKDIDKVFDPFYTTKKEGDGVGLGLSMLYSIIQNHHGTISVESEAGEGTTFTIHLPVMM